MIRGTTAAYKFKLPYAVEELEWATIKFWQPNNPSKLLPITKTKSNCGTSDNPNELCVSLTAEETTRFSDQYKAKVQLRAKHSSSGSVFGCRTQTIAVYPMLDDIIEEDPLLPDANEEGWIILDGETIVD